jgi:hypothetical protein
MTFVTFPHLTLKLIQKNPDFRTSNVSLALAAQAHIFRSLLYYRAWLVDPLASNL